MEGWDTGLNAYVLVLAVNAVDEVLYELIHDVRHVRPAARRPYAVHETVRLSVSRAGREGQMTRGRERNRERGRKSNELNGK